MNKPGVLWSSIVVVVIGCGASPLGCSATGDGSGISNPGAGGASGKAGAAGAGGSAGASGVGGLGGLAGSSGSGGSILLDAGVGGSAGTAGDPGDAAAGGSTSGGDGGACSPTADTPSKEVCGNGIDENLNGFVDEACSCTLGATQPCFGGPPSKANATECHKGTQTCAGNSEFPGWSKCDGWGCGAVPPPPEICDNQIDDNCNGQIDEGCELDVPVNIDGDCIFASCPPQAPYPVGCNIIMEGGDSRGCVATTASNPSLIYFKEGDACPFLPGLPGAGHISGSLLCSTVPKGPLNETNCPITTKTTRYYPTDPSGCP